jgi:hypothetical protein
VAVLKPRPELRQTTPRHLWPLDLHDRQIFVGSVKRFRCRLVGPPWPLRCRPSASLSELSGSSMRKRPSPGTRADTGHDVRARR